MLSQIMVSFQPGMQSNDDLAALFSRNLTFNPEFQGQNQASAPRLTEDEPKQLPVDPASVNTTPESNPSPIVYSITQHYTHSAHLVHQPSQQDQQQQGQETQRRLSEPPQTDQLTPEIVLAHHGVDPTLLSSSQLQLFRISDVPQQERLVEIWRAAPPTGNNDNPALAWTSTTVEQEEAWARLRYVRQQEEAERQRLLEQRQEAMRMDGAQVQGSDSRWLSSNIAQSCEPYMMSGYEELMRRDSERGEGPRYNKATDPVYKHQHEQPQQPVQMENQYGVFQQQNEFGGPAGNAEAMEIM